MPRGADDLLGRVGPGERAGRAVQGLHDRDRHQPEIRVRAVDELRRPLPERAELARHALRPDPRRQPVDRRLRRERLLRQAQRLLRQGRHLDGCLPAGDGGRLFRVAEEHAELLVAAGDGRRGRLDLSQGLVRAPRAAEGVQGEVRLGSRRPEDLGRVQADRGVLPGPRDRRQDRLRRVDLHRARLGRHHDGRHQRALFVTASSTRTPTSRSTWKAS